MSPDLNQQPPLVVIAGPTAVGKTTLAIQIAKQLSGEIVNADSRSFYRGMDIGTAKPTAYDQNSVPHHLIDILDPADEMSLSRFQDLAFTAIDNILERHHLPILVGGTAQYVNSVVENWKIPQVAPDIQFRAEMAQRIVEEGHSRLLEELRAVDPESAERTGPNPRRIIRALEVYHVTGVPMTQLQGKRPPRYRTLQFELWVPREVLHHRIARRVDEMLERGLIREVQTLLNHGVSSTLPAFSSIGYREVVPYINGEQSLAETAAAIRHSSNRLVRHQQTWFRKNPAMQRIDMTDDGAYESVLQSIHTYLDIETNRR